MKHTILNGDVIACLRSLPDACVQCVVTSPPYWGLRDYGVEGQIGLEPTPEAYVEKMVEVFRGVWRVLRDDGVVWLNLGDSYAQSGGSGSGEYQKRHKQFGKTIDPGTAQNSRKAPPGLKPKDLVGIPWRVAFALQADGWYLRSDIIWSKPNPMPESVTDRPTKSHEYVFLLTKQPRYFYDADAIREGHESLKDLQRRKTLDNKGDYGGVRKDLGRSRAEYYNPAGRNRRTVWVITPQPTPEAHFATFPEALVEPCVKAGTSERGACPECGAPWRRVTERGKNTGKNGRYDASETTLRNDAAKHSGRIGETPVHTVGWQPSCTCGREETVPCVVLDPFGGSGTAAKVARDLGRSSVMIELNPAYVEIMKRRLRAGGQLDGDADEIRVTSLPLTDGGVV